MPMFKPILENEATGKVKEIFGKIIPFFLKYSEVLLTVDSFSEIGLNIGIFPPYFFTKNLFPFFNWIK